MIPESLTYTLPWPVRRPVHQGGYAAQLQPRVPPEGVVRTLPRRPVAHQHLPIPMQAAGQGSMFRVRCSGLDVQDFAMAWQKRAADALAACGKVVLQLRLWTAALQRVLHLQAYSDSRQHPLPKPPWSRTRASVIAAPLLVHSKFPNGSPVLTSSRVPPAAATARRTAGSVRRTSGHHGSPAEHRHC